MRNNLELLENILKEQRLDPENVAPFAEMNEAIAEFESDFVNSEGS